MPARRGKIAPAPGQEPKDAELVDIASSQEPWTECHLADGSTIKSKLVVSEVWKILNEFNADGDPVYVVKAQVVTSTVTPEHLRRAKP